MAASAIYQRIGTPITWKDSGGTYGLTASSLANAAGRVGARGDIAGNFPKPDALSWSVTAQWIATPTANRTLDVFIAPWDDDTTPAIDFGIVGAADAALTVTKRFNLIYLGSLRVESAAVGPFTSGDVYEKWRWRYGSIAVYNDGGVALAAVGTYALVVTVTPYYKEAQ